MSKQSNTGDAPLLAQISALPSMSYTELKQLWQTLYDTKVPCRQKSGLIKRLTYRLQELAYGVDPTINQRLVDAAKRYFTAHGHVCKRAPYVRPLAGSKLVRHYKGKIYTIIVLDEGYEYEGCVYRSLSKIASLITSSNRSGVAFFGLNHIKQGRV